jgi:hypothetical protein
MNIWIARRDWDRRSALFQMMNAAYGGAAKAYSIILLAPVKIFALAQPELAEYYTTEFLGVHVLGLFYSLFGHGGIRFAGRIKNRVGVREIVIWLSRAYSCRYCCRLCHLLSVAIMFRRI